MEQSRSFLSDTDSPTPYLSTAILRSNRKERATLFHYARSRDNLQKCLPYIQFGSCRLVDNSCRERDCLPSGVRNSQATSPMDLRRRTEFQPELLRPLALGTMLQASQERDRTRHYCPHSRQKSRLQSCSCWRWRFPE